jgi:hypothetical protein
VLSTCGGALRSSSTKKRGHHAARLEPVRTLAFFRCKACGKTLTGGSPLRTQRRPELTFGVSKLIVNKVPMRRICETLDLNLRPCTGSFATWRKVPGSSPHCRSGALVRGTFVANRLRHHMKTATPDAWFAYPLADMADSNKQVRYLTDFKDLALDHRARLHMRASLRGIDKFFMQVRRRLSVLERPLSTRSNVNRGWHGYAAYSPIVAQHVLHIFRAYYNFCLVGQDGKTPAMRLGLSAQPVPLEVLSAPRSRGIK